LLNRGHGNHSPLCPPAQVQRHVFSTSGDPVVRGEEQEIARTDCGTDLRFDRLAVSDRRDHDGIEIREPGVRLAHRHAREKRTVAFFSPGTDVHSSDVIGNPNCSS